MRREVRAGRDSHIIDVGALADGQRDPFLVEIALKLKMHDLWRTKSGRPILLPLHPAVNYNFDEPFGRKNCVWNPVAEPD